MPHSERQPRFLPQLIKRLAGDGVRVAEDELNLAALELKQIIRGYVVAIAIAAASIAVMTVAIAMLAHGAAEAISSYLGSTAYAYFSVGAVLLLATVGLIFVAKRYLTKKHRPIGLIFRWLAGSAKN